LVRIFYNTWRLDVMSHLMPLSRGDHHVVRNNPDVALSWSWIISRVGKSQILK